MCSPRHPGRAAVGRLCRSQESVDLFLRKPLGSKSKDSCCYIVLDTPKLYPRSWQFGGGREKVNQEG